MLLPSSGYKTFLIWAKVIGNKFVLTTIRTSSDIRWKHTECVDQLLVHQEKHAKHKYTRLASRRHSETQCEPDVASLCLSPSIPRRSFGYPNANGFTFQKIPASKDSLHYVQCCHLYHMAANLTDFRTDKTDTNCITPKICSDVVEKKVSRHNCGNPFIKSDTLAVVIHQETMTRTCK
jgi:hypothetical protein